MVEREIIISLLKEWGRWQRTVRNPSLTYSVSQFDTPLQKKRNVRPVYLSPNSEYLEKIILKYFSKSHIAILELSYVDMEINAIAADTLKCSVKTFTSKRNEVICMLQGIYSTIKNDY